MLTYILFGIVLIYILLILNLHGGDLFYPPIIVLLSFAFSLSFVIVEMSKWDGITSFDAFFVFWIGLTAYMFGSFFAESVMMKLRIGKECCELNISHKDINTVKIIPKIESIVTLGIIVFEIIVFVNYYLDVRRSAASIGKFSDLGTMIGLYRNAGVYGELEVSISGFSLYGFMAMTAISYLYLYIIIARIVIEKRKISMRWLILNIIPIFLFCGCSILTGGRNPLIQLLVAAFMMFYLLYRRFHGISRRFNRKFAIKLAGIVMVALIIFSNMRGLVGRTNTMSLFDYLAMYIGAPIKLFDMFIQNPPSKSHDFWGQETFINVWIWIGTFLKNEKMTSLIMNKEFRTYNGRQLGNVYTAFREYYFDFGIAGVIILPFIHANFFTIFYNKIKMGYKKMRSNSFDLSIVIYSYLSVALAYYSIDDRFYQKFLSRSTFRELIILIILSVILPRIRIGKNNRLKRG